MTTEENFKPMRPPINELVEQVKGLMAENQARLDVLTRQGVQLDGSIITNIRLNTLADTLFGPFNVEHPEKITEARVAFEMRVQQHFTQMLENVETQMTRARLMQGVGNGRPPEDGNGLIIAKR